MPAGFPHGDDPSPCGNRSRFVRDRRGRPQLLQNTRVRRCVRRCTEVYGRCTEVYGAVVSPCTLQLFQNPVKTLVAARPNLRTDGNRRLAADKEHGPNDRRNPQDQGSLSRRGYEDRNPTLQPVPHGMLKCSIIHDGHRKPDRADAADAEGAVDAVGAVGAVGAERWSHRKSLD